MGLWLDFGTLWRNQSVVHAVPPPGWRDVLSAATLQWGQFLSPSQIAVVVFLLPQIQLTVPRSSYPSLEQGEGCQIDWLFFFLVEAMA